MQSVKNQLISSESDEESSLSFELVVDKAQEEEKKTELTQDNNIYDFDLETVKDKPWLKPGANIADYFNYGFTEQTWKKYCEMQRQNREWGGRQTTYERDGGEDTFSKKRRYDDERQGGRDDRYGGRDGRGNRRYR